MSYSEYYYGHKLAPDESREKALALAVSWWGQWQWYEIRRPVLDALIDGQCTLDKYRHKFEGAKCVLNFLLDMTDDEIEDYCRSHVDWLLDDYALDLDMPPMSVWIDGPRSVTDENF